MATWVDLSPATQPSTRYDVGMDWDRANGNLVLFGGSPLVGPIPPAVDSKTWLWDGTTWTGVTPAHSPVKYTSRQLIAWDGTQIIYLRPANPMQTWAWDGADWAQLSPATSPSVRVGALMAWTGDYILMFGGQSAGPLLDETWIWDGSDWTHLSPAHSPEPSDQGSLASDALGETIYFGDPGMSGFDNLTYRWDPDAVDWVLLSPTNLPPGRTYGCMAYGGPDNGLVLFGGRSATAGVDYDDTWIWRDNDWCECDPDASPTARSLAAMGYTPDGPVLFGDYFTVFAPPRTTSRLEGICCVAPPTPPIAAISHRFGLG
jgi:hypothetical protein